MLVYQHNAPRFPLRQHVLALIVALLAAGAIQSPVAADAPGAAARELGGRLIAPCCWTQTLDIHESPVADQLRAEITKRLGAGESAAAIEDDLAARYGEKIRAVPRGKDPRVALPVIVGGAMLLAVLGLTWLAVTWLRRGRSEQEPQPEANAYDKQLDQALSELSDQR